MTIFSALLFTLANLALLVAVVFLAMGRFARSAHVQRPCMVRTACAARKPLLRR